MNDYQKHLATNIYYDRNFDCDGAKILPGEYYVTQKNMVIVTVLGSCVAACIRDRVSGIGGMNHFMLPELAVDGAGVPPSLRYGTYAMEVLINSLLKAGARREHLEAKVFGGGRVLTNMDTLNVGERNAAFVKEYMAAENIPVLAEDLNDVYPRKVYFFPRTGKVLVKKIRALNNNTLATRELDYVKRLQAKPIGGEIVLFE